MTGADPAVSPEILAVLEPIAQAVHDEWARGRLAEGWRYGPHLDDERKWHPRLVPYDDLPDSEKQVDRATALMTIKTLLALGFTISHDGQTQSQTTTRATSLGEAL